MPFKKILAVGFEKYIKPINILCGQNAQLLAEKQVIYSFHCALKD
jgi:hypothetical protein